MASDWNWGVWIGAEIDPLDKHYRIIKFLPEEIASGSYHGLYSCHYGKTVRAVLLPDGSSNAYHAIKKFQILGCTDTSARIRCHDTEQCSESLNGRIVAHAHNLLEMLRIIDSALPKSMADIDEIRGFLSTVDQVLKLLPDFAAKGFYDIDRSQNI